MSVCRKLRRAEEAVSDGIKALRQSFRKVMAIQNIRVEHDSLICSSSRGYQLAPGISVAEEVRTHEYAQTHHKSSRVERQQWFLDTLRVKKKLRRCDYEARFEVAEATAKRDLAALGDQIEFKGVGKAGHYMLR